jgi:hypothetical protein
MHKLKFQIKRNVSLIQNVYLINSLRPSDKYTYHLLS